MIKNVAKGIPEEMRSQVLHEIGLILLSESLCELALLVLNYALENHANDNNNVEKALCYEFLGYAQDVCNNWSKAIEMQNHALRIYEGINDIYGK